MHAVYASISKDSAVNYHFDWNMNPTHGTLFNKPTKSGENYKLSSLYPIIHKVISYILSLPKDIVTRLIKLSSGKESISDIVTPPESGMLASTDLTCQPIMSVK